MFWIVNGTKNVIVIFEKKSNTSSYKWNWWDHFLKKIQLYLLYYSQHRQENVDNTAQAAHSRLHRINCTV